MKKQTLLKDAMRLAASKNGTQVTYFTNRKALLWFLMCMYLSILQKSIRAQAPPYPIGTAPACMKTNSLPINTGWNWRVNTEFWPASGELDTYWRIVSAEGTPTPVCATTVVPWMPAGGWGPFNQSRIISTMPDATNVDNNAVWVPLSNCTLLSQPYIFQRRFWSDATVPTLATLTNLRVKVDDNLRRISINGNVLPQGIYSTNCLETGGLNTFPNFLFLMQPGMNTIEFEVWNSSFSGPGGTSTMGINVEATITCGTNDIIRNDYYVPNVDLGCVANPVQFIQVPILVGTCVAAPATSGTVTIVNYNPTLTYALNGVSVGGSFVATTGSTYTVTVSDALGCTLSTVFTMISTVDPPIVTMDNLLYCLSPGSSIIYTGSTSNGDIPYTYIVQNSPPASISWGPPGVGNFYGGGVSLYAGIYTVTAIDANGCTGTSTFAVGNLLDVTVTPMNSQYCIPTGGSVNLIVNVIPATFVDGYSINGGAFQASNTFTVNTPGIYTITAKDVFGCTGTATIELFPSPVVTISNNNEPCDMQFTASAIPNNGVQYSWYIMPSGNNLITNPYVPGNTFPPSQQTFTVTATDANGCTGTSIESWNQNPLCCYTGEQLAGNIFSTYPTFNNATATDILNYFMNPPNNTVSNIPLIYFDGDVIIDQNITFDNCTDMQFTYNTRFILNPNVELKIQNCALKAKCNGLWKGIESTNAFPNGNKIIVSNSTLRDMLDGITATNNTEIDIQDNHFEDNYVSLRIGNTIFPYNSSVGNCIIRNNIFEHVGNANLLYPHMTQNHGERGIVVVNCQEVEIGDINASTYSNTFENIYNGIYILSTMPNQSEDYHIYNNYFHNIYWGENDWWGHAHWKVNNWAQAGSQAHRGVAIYGLRFPNTPIPNHTAHIKYQMTEVPNASFDRCDKAVMLHGMSAEIEKARSIHTLMGFMMNRADGQEFTINDNDLESWISNPGYVDFLYKGIKIVGNNGNSEITYNRIMTAPIDLPMGGNPIGPTAIEIEHPNAANTQLLSIYNNQLDHYAPTGNGIYLRNVKQQNIIRLNNVQLHNTQGPSTYVGLRAAGIQLDDCRYTQLLGNIIDGNMSLLATANHFDAIRMQSSQECILECNLLSSTPRGLRAIGNNNTGNILNVRGNSCVAHGRGWYFNYLGTAQGTLGNVGDLGNDMKNMFFSSDLMGNGYGIWREDSVIFDDKIYTTLFGDSYSGALTNFSKYNIPPNNGATQYECDYTVYTPPTWWFANMGISEEDAAQIIADSMQQAQVAESMQWAMEQELMNALERDTVLRNSNGTINTYYNTQSSSNTGIFAKINRGFAELNEKNNVNSFNTYMNHIVFIDSMNNSISANSTQEQYMQIVNNYAIKWMLGGIDTLNENEIDTLHEIANLCPVTWGNMVIRARVLYNSIVAEEYNDIALCSGGMNKTYGEGREEKIDMGLLSMLDKEAIKVYPNPTDGILTIDYHLQRYEKGEIALYDMTGKEVARKALSNMHNRESMHIQNLSSGLYLYKYMVNGVSKQMGKISKQ